MRWFVMAVLMGMGVGDGVEAGVVQGEVTVQATEKRKAPRRYYMGPYRSGRHAMKAVSDGPQNVVVYVAGATGSKKRDEPAVMQQKNETFVPHVLPVQVGTSVGFPNEDDFYHNVFSVMSGDRFDLGRYAQGETTYQTFEKPGVVVVRCEIHPGMKAYILVLETPFFVVPDETGEYELKDVPPGNYTLVAWHPEYGETRRPVTVPETGVVEADFSF